MISEDNLQELLQLRRQLLREVSRLDWVIARECGHPHGFARQAGSDLSWEAALHEAKIPLPGERMGMAMHA